MSLRDRTVSRELVTATLGAERFAFVTADGSGPYHHSGLLSKGRLIGMTHSLGRDFLAYWTAVRESRP